MHEIRKKESIKVVIVLLQYPQFDADGSLPDILKKALLAFDSVSTFVFILFYIYREQIFKKLKVNNYLSRHNPTSKICGL